MADYTDNEAALTDMKHLAEAEAAQSGCGGCTL